MAARRGRGARARLDLWVGAAPLSLSLACVMSVRLAMVYSSMSGSRVWWNMRGSSVERETLRPTAKNSLNGFLES